ncbi:DUF3558 domain-containing protein [Rhodococcus sp. NPDC054953]
MAVAGCGTVSGEAGPEQPTASNPAFDPCDDIPDDAIRAVGMDPATESRDILGVHQPGWNICGWNNDESEFLTVYATGRTLDEIRRNPDFVDFRSVDLDGRPALSFRDVNDVQQTRCDVATVVAGTSAMFSLSIAAPGAHVGDVCGEVLGLVKGLLPHLPK